MHINLFDQNLKFDKNLFWFILTNVSHLELFGKPSCFVVIVEWSSVQTTLKTTARNFTTMNFWHWNLLRNQKFQCTKTGWIMLKNIQRFKVTMIYWQQAGGELTDLSLTINHIQKRNRPTKRIEARKKLNKLK